MNLIYFFLASLLFRCSFPAFGIDLRILSFTESFSYIVHDISTSVNGFDLVLSNNTIEVASPNAFDDSFTSCLRIPVISWGSNPNCRSILGYFIVSNDGSLMIWCKRFSFGHGVLPEVYRSNTHFAIALSFRHSFLATAVAYRNGFETDIIPTMFTFDRLVANRNIIAYQSPHGGHFVAYESNHSDVCRELVSEFIRLSRSTFFMGQNDAKSHELGLFLDFYPL